MRFTIIGAGAIGAIVGVRLAHAGHEVDFIESNAEHVAAVRAGGLRLSGATEAVLRAEIRMPAEVTGSLQNVLLAVKARHTLAALEPLAPRLAPDGYVVSLQNGLEEYKIARLVGQARTIGAFLTFGGHYRAPGEIVHGGAGSFRIGEYDGARTDRIAALRDALAAVQDVAITDNIFGFLWAKMALGAVYFATALVSADVTDIYANDVYRDMLGTLAGEVVAVADASGVHVESFDGFDPNVFRPGSPGSAAAIAESWAGQRRYWDAHGPNSRRTGVWRDLAQHHRPTEVEEQVGSVVAIARERGVATPRLSALVALIHEAEAGRPLGWDMLDALAALNRSCAAA